SQLKPLIDAGFIRVVANKPQPLARIGAQPEKRREEKEKALDASPEKPNPAKTNRVPFSAPTGPPTPGRVNMPSADQTAYVKGLVANGVITEAFELDDYDLDDSLRDELKSQLLNG